MSGQVMPMLAVRGEPFDSAEYLFEVKWNGIRALADCPVRIRPVAKAKSWRPGSPRSPMAVLAV